MKTVDISWIRPEQLAEFELIQLSDEGVDVSSYKAEWEKLKAIAGEGGGGGGYWLRQEADLFIEGMDGLKNIQPIVIPDSNGGTTVLDESVLRSKIKGGWFGRASGCLLGKPIEKYNRDIIKEILSSNNTWPISDYITGSGIPWYITAKYPWNKHSGKESLLENIECMTEDDDMNYTMLNLSVLERYGRGYTTEDIANTWLQILPVLQTFTAERAAYLNLLNFVPLEEVPLKRNPYREWIGALIRADVWGWVNPGAPAAAAEYASRDAVLSHTGNGVYASMFTAAAISAAFTASAVKDAVAEGLECIPPGSLIASAVREGIDAAEAYPGSWDKVYDKLYPLFSKYHWVHSVNNSALIAAAVVWGRGDFEKTITAAVSAGLDTDSAGAAAGSITGTFLGYEKLPPKWIDPLNDRIRSSLKGFDNSSLSALAERTYKLINH